MTSRPLDFIYDPIYTSPNVPGITPKIDFLPVYENMFSKGKNYPSLALRYRFESNIDNSPDPFHQNPTTKLAQVGGSDRFRYFHQPLITFPQSLPAKVSKDTKKPTEIQNKKQSKEKSKSFAVQSLYRESAAQTDPWSPPYKIVGEGEPEVLTLTQFAFGSGLPVTLFELDMIQRAREKRQLEEKLGPVVDHESMQRRLKMMEEWELKEWDFKEKEMRRLIGLQLELYKDSILKKLKSKEIKNEARLEIIWKEKMKQLEANKEILKSKSEKTARRLENQRNKAVNFDSKQKDIISDHYFGLKKSPKKSKAASFDLQDLDSVLPVINAEKVDSKLKVLNLYSTTALEEKKWKKQLAHLGGVLSNNGLKESKKDDNLRFLVKIEKPAVRPSTPVFEREKTNEEYESGITFLQRILRGRLVQNEMHKGKSEMSDLIAKLRKRKTYQLDQSIQTLSTVDQEGSISPEKAAVDIGKNLDNLSKELIRTQSYMQVTALVELAHRTRRLREAEAQGRRELELQRREKEDEIFKKVMSNHQETIDTYLEDLILENVQIESSVKGREFVKDYIDRLNNAVDVVENDEQVVNELMKGFLFPEVNRSLIKEQVARDQRKYLLSAQKALYENQN